MSRSRIIAGKAVIVIEAQDMLDKSLGKVRGTLHRFANTASSIGDQLFKTGFLGSIASGAGINQFIKFDDALRTLRVNLDLFGKSAGQVESTMKPLEATIRRLAKTTPFSPTQVAQAATELAKGGLDPKQIMDSLQAVLDLSRATGTDLAESAKFATRTLQTYNIETSRASEVVSQLVRATRKGTLDIEDLEAAMRYSSGTANVLGVSLNRMLAVFSILSNRGLVGSIAGTSTNTALGQLIKKAQELAAVGKVELAIGTRGDGAPALDLIETLRRLFAYAETLDFTKQQQLFQDVFNLRGARSVSALKGQIDQIERLSQFIGDAGDEARTASKIIDQGLGGAVRRLISAVQDLAVAFGASAERPLMGLVNGLTEFINQLNNLVKLNPAMAASILLSPGIILGAGVGFLALSKALRVAAGAVGLFRGVYSPLMGMLAKGTAGQIAFATSLMPGRKKGKKGKKSGMSFGARTFAGLDKVSKTLSTLPKPLYTVVRLLTSIASIAADIALPGLSMTSKSSTFLIALRSIKNSLKSLWLQAKAFKSSGGIYRMLMGASGKVGDFLKNPLGKSGTALHKTGSMISGMKKAFAAGQLGRVLNPRNFTTMFSFFKGTGIAKMGTSLIGFAKGLLTAANVARRFIFSFSGVLTILEGLLLFGDRIPGISNVMERFGMAFSNAFRAISNILRFAQGPLEQFKLAFKAFVSGEGDIGVKALVRGFQNLIGIIGNQLVAAWNRFKAALGEVWDTIKQIGVTLIEVIKGVLDGIGSAISTIVSTVGTVSGVASRATGIKGGSTGDVLTTIKNFIADLGVKILHIIDAVSMLYEKLQLAFRTFILDFESMLRRTLPFVSDRSEEIAAERKKAEDESLANQIKIRNNSNKHIKAIRDAQKSDAAKEGKNLADRAASNSFGLMQKSLADAREGMAELAKRLAPQAAPLQQPTMLQQQISTQRQQVQQAIQSILPYASALVTSAQSARGNLLQLGKPIEQKQLEEQQRTNELLEGISREQGVIFAE